MTTESAKKGHDIARPLWTQPLIASDESCDPAGMIFNTTRVEVASALYAPQALVRGCVWQIFF